MKGPRPSAPGSEKPDILADIVARVLAAGATDFEAEDEDGREQVCAMKGLKGFGVASFRSDSQEARELRKRLSALKEKPGKITIQGVEYVLRAMVWDSCGEGWFRVKIKPVTG
jgi:hypothetical protein